MFAAMATSTQISHPASSTPGNSPAGNPFAAFASFGVDRSLIDAVLKEALAHGGDFADLFFQRHAATRLGLEDGNVNRAFQSIDMGVGVRVVAGDKTGYAYTEALTKEALLTAARTAAYVARSHNGVAPKSLMVQPKVGDFYHLKRTWAEVRTQEKLPFLTRLNQEVFAKSGDIKKVSVSFADSTDDILIATSDGLVVADTQPMTSLGLSCVAERNGKRESNGYNVAGRADLSFYSEERLQRIRDEAVNRTLILFQAGAAPAGEMPVVLGAGSSGILLHEAIGHGMEADFNRKGTSIYADKMNKKIASPLVTVVDDATLEGARGSINIDDEGEQVERTVLVKDGILRSYIHDRISARHYGVKTTGSGRRESYRHAPLPRMRSTYMENGPHSRDEIIKSVKRGIYCDNFSNGQVQIGAGDFTFYVKNGYLIEDGKLTQPIKDVNVIGNGPKVLEQIDMVANDLKIDEGGWTCGKDGQSVPVSQGMPTVRVAALTVGGKV